MTTTAQTQSVAFLLPKTNIFRFSSFTDIQLYCHLPLHPRRNHYWGSWDWVEWCSKAHICPQDPQSSSFWELWVAPRELSGWRRSAGAPLLSEADGRVWFQAGLRVWIYVEGGGEDLEMTACARLRLQPARNLLWRAPLENPACFPSVCCPGERSCPSWASHNCRSAAVSPRAYGLWRPQLSLQPKTEWLRITMDKFSKMSFLIKDTF